MDTRVRYLLILAAYIAAVIVAGTAVTVRFTDLDPVDSFYYVFCTSTTAGFGDLVVSPDNRLVASVFMMIGATLVLSLAANVGQWILDTVTRRRSMRRFMDEFEGVKTALRGLGADTWSWRWNWTGSWTRVAGR